MRLVLNGIIYVLLSSEMTCLSEVLLVWVWLPLINESSFALLDAHDTARYVRWMTYLLDIVVDKRRFTEIDNHASSS
jgi:hypothetical protein